MKNNNKEVILPEPENEQEKKGRKRRILFLFIGMFVLVGDLAGLLAYCAIKRNSQKKEYEVSETTIKLYDNLLSYFSKCAEDVHSKAKEIVSVTFKDNILSMSGINDDNEIVINYLTDKDNIEDALSLFEESVPSVEGTTIESSYTINSKELNIDNEYIGVISTSLMDEKYIACTYVYDEKNIISIPHQEYKENHQYSDSMTANINDDQLLYDLYYYLINK